MLQRDFLPQNIECCCIEGQEKFSVPGLLIDLIHCLRVLSNLPSTTSTVLKMSLGLVLLNFNLSGSSFRDMGTLKHSTLPYVH
ncbi:hypothetical protein BT96DRAFT_981678 [Gymnopus androsaceus JB14]|uniref:Uncharacterized protein n=1 Tax=Gymnopus androsaceus JB14 TaxID=1447944 RepID=A0A6A4GMZ9_9AGAR|nr:hypothetical protein BT96DRAFT_981678 [Gymnopus androsaceus JB14]